VGKSYDISLIGTGNLAWYLGPALENSGHSILEVFGRDQKRTKAMQERLYNATLQKDLDFSRSDSKIFILAISDDAIEEVAKAIILPDNAVLVHTSGSQPIEKLGFAATENTGVFYPLQTFTKGEKVDFEDIPLLIEAYNHYVRDILMDVAKSISKKAYDIFAEDRMAIHLAAVFACNFTNYMFYISDTLLKKHHFDLGILRPLIAETLNKSLNIGPENSQTGPARRGDLETLDRHMTYLKDQDVQDLYRILSQQILDHYHE